MAYNPNDFYGKTWIYFPSAILCAVIGGCCLIAGPLFLLEIIKGSDGRALHDAGIAMTAAAAPLLLLAALFAIKIAVRRHPIVRIDRDGLEINMIAVSSFGPGMRRPSWRITTRQISTPVFVWVPWSSISSIEVTGLPMAHFLMILGPVYGSVIAERDQEPPIADRIEIAEAEFNCSINEVAETIKDHFHGQ